MISNNPYKCRLFASLSAQPYVKVAWISWETILINSRYLNTGLNKLILIPSKWWWSSNTRIVCLWCQRMKIFLHHIIHNRMIWMLWQQWQHNLASNNSNHSMVEEDSTNSPWFLFKNSLWVVMEWTYRRLGVLRASKVWSNRHCSITSSTIIGHSHWSNHLLISLSYFSLIKTIIYLHIR